MEVLRRDLKLLIEDIDEHKDIKEPLDTYYALLANYLQTIGASGVLHTCEMLIPFA